MSLVIFKKRLSDVSKLRCPWPITTIFVGLFIKQSRLLIKDRVDDVSSLLNEDEKFFNGAIVDLSHHNLSSQCIFLRSKRRDVYGTL